MELEVGGAILDVPDEATPEQIKTIVGKFRQSPQFDALIDKKSGAPARVRTLVGSAPEPDRLANIKRFYSDAVPYGEDNFVFTDPASGRPTLYNPPGIDAGDVFAVAREATQVIGGTLGAAGGAIVGGTSGLAGGPAAPATVPAGAVTGAIAGSGLGSAAGGALFDIAANTLMGRVDTRTPGQVVLDTTLDVAGGAAGEGIGRAVGQGVKAAIAGSRPAVRALVGAFERLGIEPPAAAVSGSRATQTLAKALENSPFSADIMQQQAETVLAQTKRAADGLAARFGQAQTKQGAGGVIKQAARNAAERFDFRQGQIYDEAFDLIGVDTRVPLNSIKQLRADMENQLAGAPLSLEAKLRPALKKIIQLEDDAQQGGLPFGALREVRTMIGEDLAAPVLAGQSSSQNTAMKRVYGALTEDMSAAAQAAGGDAGKKLAAADRYTRIFMNTAAKTLEKIDRFDADERAFEFAMTSSRDGGTALSRLRRNFEPEEWDTVAATVFSRLGLARAGAQDAAGEAFSVSTFLTNWGKLAPEAKEALFGGNRYKALKPALDDLTKVVESLKDVEKLTNTSNTARALVTLTSLGVLGSAAGGFLGGTEGAGGGALTAMSSVLAPRAAAKLMTSPRFVQWLARPASSLRDVSAHFGRLYAIASAEPEIAEEIGQYVSAMRAITSDTGAPPVPAGPPQ